MMKLTLLKYAVLLAALCICIYVLLVKYSFTNTMLFLTTGLAVLYVLLSLAGSMQASKKAEKRSNVYNYYTPGLITKKSIRMGSFAIGGFVLFLSGSKVMLFSLPLLAMLVSELIDLVINIRNHAYYLYFDDKALVFQQDAVKRVFASHIREIEFRYEIFYLTLTNNQVRMVETEKIPEAERAGFIKAFVNWGEKNAVSFTAEAREKLKM